MKYTDELFKKGFMTDKSREILREHDKKMEDENLRPATKEQISWTVKRFMVAIEKPVEDITPEDISEFFANLNSSETTKNNYKINMKSFFKRIGMEENSKSIHLLKKRALKKLPKKLVDRKILKKMMQVCTNSRDRAMLFTFFETGARKSELLTLRKSDLLADEYGFVVIINGKTGERRVRLIEAAPDLRIWLNDHPDKRPDAPLWVSFANKNYGKRIHKESVRHIFQAISERAGVDMHVYPHLLRKSRATELASLGFSETQLNKFFGWEFGSPMPRIYIQRAGVDVDSKLLEISGIKLPEKKKLETLKVDCEECGKRQSPTASFCYDCGAILSTDAGKQVKNKTSPLRQEMSELKEALRETNEYKEMMKKLLKERGEKIVKESE